MDWFRGNLHRKPQYFMVKTHGFPVKKTRENQSNDSGEIPDLR